MKEMEKRGEIKQQRELRLLRERETKNEGE